MPHAVRNTPQPARTVPQHATEPSQKIIREPLFGDGERFILPYRQLGEAKKFGWVGVGFGILATLFMIGWISGPLAIGVGLLMNGQLFGLMPIAFSFLGIMGLRFAILLLVGGWATKNERTRTVLEVRGDKLTAIEEFHWMRWKRRCKLTQIEQLAYRKSWKKQNEEIPFDDVGGALLAKQDGKQPWVVSGGYPNEILTELAASLATHFNNIQIVNTPNHKNAETFVQDRQRVEVVEVDEADQPPVEKPADSNLEIVHHDRGIKLDLPPTGFKSFFGVFSLVWLAFTTFIMVAMLFSKEGVEGPAWIGWLVLGLFESVGLGMFAYALNSGRRRTSLVTADDRLLLVSESLFGKRRNEWSKNQLYRICVGDSNVSVNDEPIQELQFHDDAGKKFGCLSERTEAELDWIAFELNNALGIDPNASQMVKLAEVSRDAKGRPIPSSKSLTSVDYKNDTTSILVPARGMRTFVTLAFNGLTFIILGTAIGSLFAWYEDNLLDVIIPAGFCGMFAIVGVAIVVQAIVLAKRGFEFEASPRELHVYRTGWLSKKSMQWNRDELKSVAVADSGTKINNRSLKHLKIIGSNRKTFSGMTDHSLDDLSLVSIAISETMSLSNDTNS